jgi:hypothetical protein
VKARRQWARETEARGQLAADAASWRDTWRDRTVFLLGTARWESYFRHVFTNWRMWTRQVHTGSQEGVHSVNIQ